MYRSLMNFRCFNTTDPVSVNVTHIYNGLVDTGSLWTGEPSGIMVCSNNSHPSSSGCLPCILNQTVHVICKDIPEKVKLVMEAVGEHIIDNIKADTDFRCRTFLETSSSGPEAQPGRHVEETGGEFPWWGGLIIALGIIIIIIISVLVHKRRSILEFGSRFCRRANPADTNDRSMNGVDTVVDETSTPLV